MPLFSAEAIHPDKLTYLKDNYRQGIKSAYISNINKWF
jgi:hypothetical protein